MLTKVSVTIDDILLGKPIADLCPIALALKRIFKPTLIVEVGLQDVSVFYVDTEECLISMPRSATDFVLGYDSEENCDPFDFELDIPEHFLK